LAAEAAGTDLVVAPVSQVLAIRGEFLHPPHRGLGGVDVAGAVERHKLRPAHARGPRRVASELSRFGTVFAPLGQELALPVEDLDATVGLVRDIDSTVPGDGDAADIVEFAVASSALAPLAQKFPLRAVDRDAVGSPLLAQPRRGKMSDVQIAGAIHR